MFTYETLGSAFRRPWDCFDDPVRRRIPSLELGVNESIELEVVAEAAGAHRRRTVNTSSVKINPLRMSVFFVKERPDLDDSSVQ